MATAACRSPAATSTARSSYRISVTPGASAADTARSRVLHESSQATLSEMSGSSAAHGGSRKPSPAGWATAWPSTWCHRPLSSAIALAIMVMVAIWLGWLMAGRVLRPLRTMTAATRRISEVNLHERLAVQGPGDELKDLGDTIDGLLGRLEGAFDAQRRFVANASHELRTPLTVERVMLETALADPDASVQSLRATCEELLVTSSQQEQIIQALLTLARSQRGLEHREPFDLAAVTGEVLAARYPEAQRRGLRIDASLTRAMSTGDRRLAQRLVANLADNALRHNVADGWIDVVTGIRAGRSVIWIANSGPLIPQKEVSRLFQPFQRGGQDRTARLDGDGLGLGLSIVEAIATAHGATVKGRPQPGGGLDVEVAFPAASCS